ncbi:hypothetical protein GGX14DRAFT_651551 [Mycena pura]|uniref:Uncharacterized protein n=1 Tax=Mycena pura TaxID=153505 RepID=A0AAD6V5I6_9AGAR|nr:hypothetical protein GGX14DRAFT_651551 [Mycena pura]
MYRQNTTSNECSDQISADSDGLIGSYGIADRDPKRGGINFLSIGPLASSVIDISPPFLPRSTTLGARSNPPIPALHLKRYWTATVLNSVGHGSFEGCSSQWIGLVQYEWIIEQILDGKRRCAELLVSMRKDIRENPSSLYRRNRTVASGSCGTWEAKQALLSDYIQWRSRSKAKYGPEAELCSKAGSRLMAESLKGGIWLGGRYAALTQTYTALKQGYGSEAVKAGLWLRGRYAALTQTYTALKQGYGSEAELWLGGRCAALKQDYGSEADTGSKSRFCSMENILDSEGQVEKELIGLMAMWQELERGGSSTLCVSHVSGDSEVDLGTQDVGFIPIHPPSSKVPEIIERQLSVMARMLVEDAHAIIAGMCGAAGPSPRIRGAPGRPCARGPLEGVHVQVPRHGAVVPAADAHAIIAGMCSGDADTNGAIAGALIPKIPTASPLIGNQELALNEHLLGSSVYRRARMEYKWAPDELELAWTISPNMLHMTNKQHKRYGNASDSRRHAPHSEPALERRGSCAGLTGNLRTLEVDGEKDAGHRGIIIDVACAYSRMWVIQPVLVLLVE